MDKSLGQLGYEKYKKSQNGRGARGQKLGDWSKLTDAQKEEWERAALQFMKAKTAIDEARKERPNGR